MSLLLFSSQEVLQVSMNLIYLLNSEDICFSIEEFRMVFLSFIIYSVAITTIPSFFIRDAFHFFQRLFNASFTHSSLPKCSIEEKENAISKVSEGNSNLVPSILNTVSASSLYGNGAYFFGFSGKSDSAKLCHSFPSYKFSKHKHVLNDLLNKIRLLLFLHQYL